MSTDQRKTMKVFPDTHHKIRVEAARIDKTLDETLEIAMKLLKKHTLKELKEMGLI